MKTLILGISVRAAVESAVRSGYSVLALDAFGDSDTRSLAPAISLPHDLHLRYSPQALYGASRGFRYDAVAYTANLENHPDALERISSGCRIIGNTPQTVRAVRGWPDLYCRLKQAGYPVPETIFAGEERNRARDGRWLIKPVSSGGGHGIYHSRGNELPGDGTFLQRFVPGKSCSVSFVANKRECTVIGIAEQLAGLGQFGSRGFRYCGSILPLRCMNDPATRSSVLGQVRRLAGFLTREYGLTGVNGIDFVLKGDRVYLTEVNPRYSASMELIEMAYRLPVFHVHARAALSGELPEFSLDAVLGAGRFVGKAILFAERNAVAPDTKRWLDKGIKDVPASGEPLRKGDPVCTVFADELDYDGTLAVLIRKAEELKKEIYG